MLPWVYILIIEYQDRIAIAECLLGLVGAYRYHTGPAQHPADALVRPADYSKAWLHTFSA